MGTLAQKSQGVVARIGTQAANPVGDTYTAIAEVDGFGEFGPESPVIDTTDLDDTVRHKLKGIPDTGELTLQFNRSYQDAGQQALLAAAKTNDNEAFNFEIEFEDQITPTTGSNTKIVFKAHVTSFKSTPGEVDGKVTGTATLAITGDTTETVAT